MSDFEGAPPPLSGAPAALVVDGIVDGRVRDAQALRQAVELLGKCGAGAFRVDVTGGRFNMLPVETHAAAGGFDEAAQANFLDRLQAVVDAAQPDSVETTLRCKLVYDEEVAETLFVVRGAAVEPVTRRRPKSAQDAPSLPPTLDDAPMGVRRKEWLLIAPLLVIAGLLVAWKTGYIDRVLSARAESLQTDTGPFSDMVQLEVSRLWGNYELKITRGAGYPGDPEALAARKEAAATLSEQAACTVVGDGDKLYVQLRSAEGALLESRSTQLRELLLDPDGEVRVVLSGKISGDTVALSLSKDGGAKKK